MEHIKRVRFQRTLVCKQHHWLLQLMTIPSFPTLPLWDYSMGHKNKGKLFMIPWSFIPIFRHSQQSGHFTFYDLILMRHQEDMIYRSNYWMTHYNQLLNQTVSQPFHIFHWVSLSLSAWMAATTISISNSMVWGMGCWCT